MELTKEQLDTIANRLCTLATYCHFVYDEAIIGARLIGAYSKSPYEVENRLRSVLCSSDNLIDSLRIVSSSLDDLLIRNKVFDDAEISDV